VKMKPIERGEILGLADYETIRPRFRSRVIEEKKRRRVALGPRASVLFENRDTVLLQIQEMLRTERITREAAIAHEIETYNAFIPGDHELSCTLMLEIDDKAERDTFLVAARGIEDAVMLVVDGEKLQGRTTPDRVLPDRASAVIYLKLPLGERGTAAIVAGARGEQHAISIAVAHAAYRAEATLPHELVVSLAEDLA
jgi:hypothetical protein